MLAKPIYKLFFLLFLTTAIILVCGCTKEDVPPSDSGNPVFKFAGKLEGQSINIEAGIENFYMFTSYRIDSCGQMVLIARLAKDSLCAVNCQESLLMEITDPDINPNDFDPKEVLNKMEFEFIEPDSLPSFVVNFESLAEGVGPLSYNWDFGDGQNSQATNPVHKYPDQAAMYEVILQTNDQSGCAQMHSKMVQVNPNSFSTPDCTADFMAVPDSFQTILISNAAGVAPFTYFWSNGQTGSSIPFDTTSASYCLTITDATGCTSSLCKSFQSSGTMVLNTCSANFTYSGQSDLPGTDSCPPGVRVQYTDSDGKIFCSTKGIQPIGSFFNIMEVEDYDLNEKGQRTKKFMLDMSAILYDGSGAAFELTNVAAVLAVAYP